MLNIQQFKPTFTMIKMMILLCLKLGIFLQKLGKKDTFWHGEYNPITAIESTKNKPCNCNVPKILRCP